LRQRLEYHSNEGEQITNPSGCPKTAPLNSNDITGEGEALKIQVRF
jgi:hypothetical protein